MLENFSYRFHIAQILIQGRLTHFLHSAIESNLYIRKLDYAINMFLSGTEFLEDMHTARLNDYPLKI